MLVYLGLRVFKDATAPRGRLAALERLRGRAPYLADARKRYPEEPAAAFPAADREIAVPSLYVAAARGRRIIALVLLLALGVGGLVLCWRTATYASVPWAAGAGLAMLCALARAGGEWALVPLDPGSADPGGDGAGARARRRRSGDGGGRERGLTIEGRGDEMAHAFGTHRRAGRGVRLSQGAQAARRDGVRGERRSCYPPGYEGVHHYHDTQDELYFVHSGKARFDVDGEERTLEAGGLCHVESTTPRKVSNASETEDLVLLVVGGSGGYVERDGHS